MGAAAPSRRAPPGTGRLEALVESRRAAGGGARAGGDPERRQKRSASPWGSARDGFTDFLRASLAARTDVDAVVLAATRPAKSVRELRFRGLGFVASGELADIVGQIWQ